MARLSNAPKSRIMISRVKLQARTPDSYRTNSCDFRPALAQLGLSCSPLGTIVKAPLACLLRLVMRTRLPEAQPAQRRLGGLVDSLTSTGKSQIQ